jgi:hypothetical protein
MLRYDITLFISAAYLYNNLHIISLIGHIYITTFKTPIRFQDVLQALLLSGTEKDGARLV